MFTGIIEELGVVRETGDRLVVCCTKAADDSEPGASLAVNGVCLTVSERTSAAEDEHGALLAFDLAPETTGRSSLGRLRPGDHVNLERAVTLLTRLGGHLVQGHVDVVGVVQSVEEAEVGKTATISLAPPLTRYVVEKGAIALDGVSLTIAAVDGERFTVALVPYTLEATTLSSLRAGDEVNLEVDVLAKYVEGLLRERR